jgi:mannose-1-phosphate guanylyltransferase
VKVRKALLLAAGIGSRLRPLTEKTPKCLLPVCGRPILGWWLDRLERHGVEEVVVNTHYLSGQVAGYLAGRAGKLRIHVSEEPELLGSAGTLAANWDLLASDGPFLVCNADTLTDVDLSRLLQTHVAGRKPLTLTVFESPDPSSCGIVDLDERGVVTSFEEKPANPRSNLANGGVYVVGPAVESELPSHTPADIGYELLPRFVGRMTAFRWTGVLHDIGTVESYEQAGPLWRSRQEAA